MKPDDRLMRQYILSYTVDFGKPEGPYSPEEELKLLEALYITLPRCDLEELNLGRYTMEEVALLNQIAVAYAETGQQKKAIDIYRQLLRYMKKHMNNRMSRYAGKITLIVHNYALELFLMGHYDDALEIAELGRKACVEYAHYQFLPGLLDIIGGCYYYKGDTEKCREYYRHAYSLYVVTGNDRDRLFLERDAKERLGLEYPF